MYISPTNTRPLFTNICRTYHFHSVGRLSDTYCFYCASGQSLEECVPPERPYKLLSSVIANRLKEILHNHSVDLSKVALV